MKRHDSGKRVLVIDDEKDLREVLSIQLAGAGFSVETARDGFDGLGKAKSFHPDVVLIDMVMPDMEGWEVCRRLKKEPETKDIPVLIMTASQIELRDTERRAEAAGASGLMRKPFDMDELVSTLRRA